ncbi:type II toxin-antitoxin system YafQ family toxin [Patescibacteria group bacterium]|nr:type II toxin-antitoxin system YafQ family toxin [Patescibacteria group bacterium]
MKIKYHANFVKNYKKRVRGNVKLEKKFERRIRMFMVDASNPVLRNHRLRGEKRDYWSFGLSGDMRVIYRKMNDEVWLYDIGTHNQVY